jgi:hypothetical protein
MGLHPFPREAHFLFETKINLLLKRGSLDLPSNTGRHVSSWETTNIKGHYGATRVGRLLVENHLGDRHMVDTRAKTRVVGQNSHWPVDQKLSWPSVCRTGSQLCRPNIFRLNDFRPDDVQPCWDGSSMFWMHKLNVGCLSNWMVYDYVTFTAHLGT